MVYSLYATWLSAYHLARRRLVSKFAMHFLLIEKANRGTVASKDPERFSGSASLDAFLLFCQLNVRICAGVVVIGCR